MRQERLTIFFERFPLLERTLDELDGANIPYSIGGSGCLFLLGNERLPDDVDMYIPNDRHDEADRLFGIESFQYRSSQEDVRNSNPEGDHSIQLTSHLVLNLAGKRYDLSITPDVLRMRLEGVFNKRKVFLYPPEDVLLVKALLQRGTDVGKHDIEDIKSFLAIFDGIRGDYLQSRIRSLGAEERIGRIFG